MRVTIDWGARSARLQQRLKHRVKGASFWLTPTVVPVRLSAIGPGDVSGWDQLSVGTPLAVTWTPGATSATVVIPPTVTMVRLDFELRATVGGQTAPVLAFRQLLGVVAPSAQDGAPDPNVPAVLLRSQFSYAATILTPNPPDPPIRQPLSTGRRRFFGLHPLLDVTPGLIAVNAEFVDATDLWWMVRNDQWRWYLDPDTGGRPANLRVLAWTGGGQPMIWFAVIPDAAAHGDLGGAPKPPGSPASSSSETPAAKGGATSVADPNAVPADVVFFRPQVGVNSITYSADAAGFASPKHDNTTMFILARYLLSPLDHAKLPAVAAAGRVPWSFLLADQIQPASWNQKTSPPTAEPADPMKIDAAIKESAGGGFRPKFRPVGLEQAVNRAGNEQVLFLPLAGGNHDHPYEGAVLADLRSTVRSAMTTLWTVFAVGRLASVAPAFERRELWLAGHSQGNVSMWSSLEANAADVGRVLAFDPSKRSDNLDIGLPRVTIAAQRRKKLGKMLDLMAIVTPNLTQKVGGLDKATDLQLRRTGARVTVFPPLGSDYWKLPPTTATNAYLRYLLANWSDAQLAASAKTPNSWFFLFFHEMAVFGGDLVQTPAAPAGPGGSKAAPPAAPRVRTFFEQALGPPSPRPPP